MRMQRTSSWLLVSLFSLVVTSPVLWGQVATDNPVVAAARDGDLRAVRALIAKGRQGQRSGQRRLDGASLGCLPLRRRDDPRAAGRGRQGGRAEQVRHHAAHPGQPHRRRRDRERAGARGRQGHAGVATGRDAADGRVQERPHRGREDAARGRRRAERADGVPAGNGADVGRRRRPRRRGAGAARREGRPQRQGARHHAAGAQARRPPHGRPDGADVCGAQRPRGARPRR